MFPSAEHLLHRAGRCWPMHLPSGFEKEGPQPEAHPGRSKGRESLQPSPRPQPHRGSHPSSAFPLFPLLPWPWAFLIFPTIEFLLQSELSLNSSAGLNHGSRDRAWLSQAWRVVGALRGLCLERTPIPWGWQSKSTTPQSAQVGGPRILHTQGQAADISRSRSKCQKRGQQLQIILNVQNSKKQIYTKSGVGRF